MSESSPKTIQIFLPHGNARGIRLAEITSRTVRAIQVPRNQFNKASDIEELSQVGVYFLFGESEDQAKPEVYIGEAENCLNRLKQHNQDRDFWRTAVAIVSRTERFTKTHGQYLEWVCWKQAQEIDRYKIHNKNTISEPYISKPMKAELQDNYETIRTLLSTLEFPLLDDPKEENDKEIFNCEGPDAKGKGIYVEDGFLILAGSKARMETTDSFSGKAERTRQNLVESGTVNSTGDQLIFEEDFMASSPSHAACIIRGSAVNGWEAWKNEDGKTLDEVKRQVNDD